MGKDKPLVAIKCIVFNHEPYLRDCFEGFVMQKTNFRFVAVVHDDASTDNSAAIIREYAEKYPDIIKPIYETENQYSKHDGSLTRIMNDACKGTKYIAMCEGDDYWTDPYKLQKQVDYLEAHPEYDMVCARFNRLIHETGEIKQTDLYDHIMPDGVVGMELKQEHFVHFVQPHPCTVMYRIGTLYDHPIYPKLKYKFDIPTYYIFLYNHKIWLMADKMAIYRKHQGSLTTMGESETWSLQNSHSELLSYFPNDTNLQKMVGNDLRKNIIRKSGNKSFSFEEFAQLLKNYLKYHPSYRNIISLLVRVIQQRLRLLKILKVYE